MLSCIYAYMLLAYLQACWHDMSAYCTSMLDWFYARMPCVRMLAGCYVNMQACFDSACFFASLVLCMHVYLHWCYHACMLSFVHASMHAWFSSRMLHACLFTFIYPHFHSCFDCESLHACMILCVSLPREWIQGIKRMATMYFMHSLFLTCIQKSHLYLHYMHLGIYTMYKQSVIKIPLHQ
jgi:hypothetical protein